MPLERLERTNACSLSLLLRKIQLPPGWSHLSLPPRGRGTACGGRSLRMYRSVMHITLKCRVERQMSSRQCILFLNFVSSNVPLGRVVRTSACSLSLLLRKIQLPPGWSHLSLPPRGRGSFSFANLLLRAEGAFCCSG